MSAVSIAAKPVYQPTNKVRFVTATSLFDGHDATVNIMRRVLQASGAEVCRAWPSPRIKAVTSNFSNT